MSSITSIAYVRPPVEDDLNFIIATFLKGLYYGNDFYGMIQKDDYMKNYEPIVKAILANNLINIACLKEDPGVILGYSILTSDQSTVHFTFIKAAWRSKGLFQLLVPNTITGYSHFTNKGLSIVKSKFNQAVFTPFKIA